ncbi:MAG: substrate-binding domain-containing protein [Oscillospiraceae bacterium]|nr:substrate-binding domain-containing protein [Oscillospiraceae bacterium]
MKKLFAIAIILASLTFALTACTESGDGNDNPGSNPDTNRNIASENPGTPAAPEPPDSGNNGGNETPVSNFDTSRNVTIIAREDGSGTKSAFMEIIGLKGKADPTDVIIQTGTAGVLTEVKGNPAAIAYESLGFTTDEVKILKVDGADATVANIKSGTYKISRPLSVVYKEATINDGINKAFFAFLQSSDAQEIISEEGYISIIDNADAYTIDGSLSGEIDISGSTSLQPLMIELASAFENLQPNVSVNVSGGGSGTGYKNANDDVSAFGMISENFNIDNAPLCTFYEVAKDGIAVIVNKSNPLDDISMEELKNIYDEDVTTTAKWSDLIK